MLDTMRTAQIGSIQARIVALRIRADGMTALNEQRAATGNSMGYDEAQFAQVADEVDAYADELKEIAAEIGREPVA